MKVNMFLPEYMVEFKCISSKCTDTCCAGWDINLDENTYNEYINSKGEFNKLVKNKFFKNEHYSDFFNYGLMVLKDESRCPFLNINMLCDIHGGIGENHLCITCRNYPRVFNIIDNVYEKSGLSSCEEICVRAFLNKEKMEFIEVEEELDETNIEIRRIIDTDAFEDTESLLQYFWDIRIMSINIIQNRKYSIEERLDILYNFYITIENLYKLNNFDEIDALLENFENNIDKYLNKYHISFRKNNYFYFNIANNELCSNIKGVRLKKCLEEYKNGILLENNISDYLYNNPRYFSEFKSYSYILENYLVNQIFKDLIPFNKGSNIIDNSKKLINTYILVKAYTIGIAINNQSKIDENAIIRVIQALGKDIEHNKVLEDILNMNLK